MRLALALLTGLAAAPAAADDLRYLKEPLIFGPHGFRAYENGRVPALGPGERAVTFSSVDRNRNRVWDPYEIVAAFGTAARDVILSFDADADGHVSLLEIRAFDDGYTGGPDGILWERVRG